MPSPSRSRAARRRTDESTPDARIVGVLFADVVGFSKLSDIQFRSFVRNFLGEVGRVALRSAYKPFSANTWGDGLYYQFDSVRDTGLFGLELTEMVTSERWEDHDLPRGLTLRVAVHAGPLFECRDPVTRRPALWGTHVTRAARIEPVTPPGNVYASREFAALAAAAGVTEFSCEHVGRVSLAKMYGAAVLYHVRRRAVAT